MNIARSFFSRKPTCTEHSGGQDEAQRRDHGVNGTPNSSSISKTKRHNPTSGTIQTWSCSKSCLGRLEQLQTTLSNQERAMSQMAKEHGLDKARFQRKIMHLEKLVARQKAEATDLASMVEDKDADLNRAESKIAILEKRISQRGRVFERTCTEAVSMLAQEVSRDIPDDVIRREFQNFFHGEFLSWCAVMCSHAVDEQRTLDALQQLDIFNGHLSLDFSIMKERTSFVLLQAVLSRFLCAHFLSHAYFLAPDPHGLLAVESILATKSLTEAVDWRVQTVQHLARSCRYDATDLVQLFVTHFDFLLQSINAEAHNNLKAIVSRFSELSTAIWKVRSTVQVVGMNGFTERRFMVGDDFAECEAQLLSECGGLADGRYIAAVLRPLIVSHPVSEPQCSVVWSKAVVWV